MNATSLSGSGHQHRPTFGIAVFIGNLGLMALISAAVRLLSNDYPLAEILLFRYIAATAIFLILLYLGGGVASLATARPLDHLIRSISGIISLGLFYFALTRIPIADATAVAYSAPIFITILSVFLLGEKIGLRRIFAVIGGFAGVLLIARPDVSGVSPGVLAAIASAIFGALVAIWLRKLSSSEKSVTIGVYYNCLGTLFCILWVLTGDWVAPQSENWLLFLVFALMCGLQQWWLTISFRYAEASLLAPFEYLAMVFAAIVGYVFWQEVPVLTTWLGAAVITLSGLIIFLRRNKSRTVGIKPGQLRNE
ncbi:MAG: drug/metabolite transporter (DMT)-like permease [Gammaproteobacteria bacterium]|jgi:drug/metabolite transporter (DMT)-like permease